MKTKPASLLAGPLGKALSGISPSCCGRKWPATPKRLRIAHSPLSRDRRINMQLNSNTVPLMLSVKQRSCEYQF